jgi:hypothetical protein
MWNVAEMDDVAGFVSRRSSLKLQLVFIVACRVASGIRLRVFERVVDISVHTVCPQSFPYKLLFYGVDL